MNKELDSFRFYAFLSVFLFHAKFLEAGYMGVQAFFVLSGFLLTPSLVTLKTLEFGQYLKIFYGRRTLRIFPLYYAYLFILGCLAFFLIRVLGWGHKFITNFYETLPQALSYTYNFYHASINYQHNPLMNHFWSLSVEEQIYLVWPFIIWLTPTHKITRLLILFVTLGPIFRLTTFYIISFTPLKPFLTWPDLVIYLVPWSHLDAFALGGLVSLSRYTLKKRATNLVFLFTFLIGFFLQFLIHKNHNLSNLGYPPIMHDDYRFIWGYSLMNLCFALLIKDISLGRRKIPTFDWPIVNYLGRISYGLYIYHFPCIFLFSLNLFKNNSAFLNSVLAFVVTIFISTLSFEFLEKRFITLKDVWFSKVSGTPQLDPSIKAKTPNSNFETLLLESVGPAVDHWSHQK